MAWLSGQSHVGQLVLPRASLDKAAAGTRAARLGNLNFALNRAILERSGQNFHDEAAMAARSGLGAIHCRQCGEFCELVLRP